MNPLLQKYLISSIAKFFKNIEDEHIYIEGEEIDLDKYNSWVEVRMNGPSKHRYSERYDIGINAMCSAKQNSNDIYNLQKLTGKIAAAMNTEIPVYSDPDTQVGCLILRNDVALPLDVVQWGLISAEVKTRNASVDGYYKLEL